MGLKNSCTSDSSPMRDLTEMQASDLLKSRGECIALWKIHATNKYNAVRLLWDASTIGRLDGDPESGVQTLTNEIQLLMGLSLENLLEALIIQNGSAEFPTKLRSIHGTNHNLMALIKEVGCDIESTESEMITDCIYRWSTCVSWRGRYPIPTNAKYLTRPISGSNGQDFKIFDALFKRFNGMLVDGI